MLLLTAQNTLTITLTNYRFKAEALMIINDHFFVSLFCYSKFIALFLHKYNVKVLKWSLKQYICLSSVTEALIKFLNYAPVIRT